MSDLLMTKAKLLIPTCIGRCERCDDVAIVEQAPVRTSYADGSDPQPLLCAPCIVRWNEYWDEQWSSYYAGLL